MLQLKTAILAAQSRLPKRGDPSGFRAGQGEQGEGANAIPATRRGECVLSITLVAFSGFLK